MRKTFVYFICVSIWINTSETQTIYTCNSPEKKSHCTLRCKTKDFLQPVTFSHPPNHDIGSCIPPDRCHSNYERYRLSQKKIGIENITNFHIDQLSRKDEGEWICSYGNKPSAVKYLTVHTRPENVDLSVNETGSSLIVECFCYCVNHAEYIRMEIQISNDDRKIKTSLDSLNSLDIAEHKCLSDDENTIIGKYNAQKDKWPGNYIDISCSCFEEKLHYTQTASKRHSYQGIPKEPKDFKAIVKSAYSVVLNWKKSDSGGSKQTFVVEYKEVLEKSMHNITRQESEKDEYNATLERLKPDTEYRVWIYAYNQNGNSTKNGPVSFRTLKEETLPLLAIVLPIILTVVAVAIIIIIVVVFFRRRKIKQSPDGEYELPFLEGDRRDVAIELAGYASTKNKDANEETLGDTSRMNIENTKALIKRIAQPDFVKTTSYTQGIAFLNKFSILIYKGVYGDGRFTNAVHMLKYFQEEQYYQPAVIHDITKWDEIVNVNVRMILLIPDILSKLTIDKKLYERVYPYLEKMMGCVESKKTKVIMTCESEIMNDLWYVLRDYDIFKRVYHIDLADATYKLTSDEKENILKVHCERNNIEICKDEKEENYENAKLINGKPTIKICQKTITEIAENGNPIGYPQNCFLLCKHRAYTALGKNFFLRPKKCVLQDIDNLKNNSSEEKNLQYTLLKEMWFEYPGLKTLDNENYGKALKGLLGIYIEKQEDKQYVLKHETIYIAVGLSIIKDDPQKVIKQSNWNFLRYHIKPLKSKTVSDKHDDGTTFYISKNLYDVVTERCLADLQPDSLFRYFRYFLECWPGNAKRILQAIKTKEKYKENRKNYLEIIQKSCEIADESGIFVQACMYGNTSAIKELKNYFRIPEHVLNHCLAILQNKLDVLSVLDSSQS